MIRGLRDWINHRIGLADIVQHALYEPIPGGARFRYITGSVLVFAFITQTITGIFLWMAYSPSSQSAYESVWYIQHQMTGGWLVRGIHHFMAQAMVVVMALHLLQVIWDGAYRAPREVNYWLGLVLLQLVMGLGLTGYLLPWDQKGYWATNVATNLATLVPFVGKDLQQLAVGGNEYGHHTLTRFFAMHAGVLPALLVIFLVLHIAIFRRHGIMAKLTPGRADDYFWPRQVLFDAIGCLVLLVIVLLCVIHFDLGAFMGQRQDLTHLGAELGAPADPAEQYSAARPEWYYLFLFQLLKYFPGSSEIWGAIVIPGIVMTVLALLPFIGRTNIGHQFSRAFIVALLAGAGVLTCLAWSDDYFAYLAKWLRLEGEPYAKKLVASQEFLAAREDAARDAQRTNELINRREMQEDDQLSEPRLIQTPGAVFLLRNDPKTRGPRLFKQHCANCHDYVDAEGKRPAEFTPPLQSPETTADGKVKRDEKGNVVYPAAAGGAPNLFGFGTRAWIKGILNPDTISKIAFGEPQPSSDSKIAADKEHPDNYKRPIDAPYFGNTNHKAGRMATWVKQHAELLKSDAPADPYVPVDAIAEALSAQAELRTPGEASLRIREMAALQRGDLNIQPMVQMGIRLIQQHCTSCHRFGEQGQLGLAPDLTGYGSYEWMMGLVSDPSHERFYRMENDRMPSFARHLDRPERNNVSTRELSLIVDWIRGSYFQADDPAPVLPHSPEQANQATMLARTIAEPRSSLVGAPAAAKESQLARAERLFRQNCAACHSRIDAAGHGVAAQRPTAPNLAGLGSREWVLGILDPERIKGPEYFGNTRHKGGDMAGFVESDLTDPDDEKKARLAAIAAALAAEAGLPADAETNQRAEADKTLEKGRAALAEAFDSSSCTDCHKFRETGELGSAPDLTGWGSKDWLVRFMTDPTHEAFYRDTNDRMPSFGNAGPGPRGALLSAEDIDLLARWLRGEKLE